MRENLHTPWSDVIVLIAYDQTQNASGYPATPADPADESRRCVFCTFEDGVSQNEYYLSEKTGHRASASVEIHAVDYENEEYAEFAGGFRPVPRLYKVIRTFRSSFDCVTLILEEVVRS